LVAGLTTGTHTLYFTAVDAVGNRLADDKQHMNSVVVNIDGQVPQSALLSVPAGPNGANGWFTVHPWVSISAIDQEGASGLQPGIGDNPVAGIYYYKDGALQPPVSPPFPPFQLLAGQHDVCWFARDVAGNRDVNGAGGPGGPDPTATDLLNAGHCQHFSVDDAAPTVSINPTPAGPNGLNGWYTSAVPVQLTASDGAGSGVNPAFDPADQALLCAPTPKATDPRPSGICVSIDNAGFVPYTAGFTIPEGVHDVRAFAVDVSGQRSATQDLPIVVDLSPPRTTARLTPGAPAKNGWFRSAPYAGHPEISPPMVTLRAVDGDQNSGVSLTQYQIDTNDPTLWKTYTGPFPVAEGVHTVLYRSVDQAGLVEPTNTLPVSVDITPPVVQATSPIPALWLQLLNSLGNILGLSPAQAQLQWTVSDNLSPHAHITVLVFNVAGAVVRQLDGGTYNLTPGTTLNGSTNWDGKDQTITNIVPIGLYYYRVVATDDAGNAAQSGESKPIQIKASLGL
jgi:hypothetical protein